MFVSPFIVVDLTECVCVTLCLGLLKLVDDDVTGAEVGHDLCL